MENDNRWECEICGSHYKARCPECDGSGIDYEDDKEDDKECEHCSGSGVRCGDCGGFMWPKDYTACVREVKNGAET